MFQIKRKSSKDGPNSHPLELTTDEAQLRQTLGKDEPT